MMIESFDASVAEVAVSTSCCFHDLAIGTEAFWIISYQKFEKEVGIIVKWFDVAGVGIG